MKTVQEIHALMQDKTFRANLINDVDTYAPQLGYNVVDGIDFNVVANTKKTFHCVMPNNTNDLNNQISQIQAAGGLPKTSTVSTVGSAGTASTVCSSLGTVGSVGSAASLGSHGDLISY